MEYNFDYGEIQSNDGNRKAALECYQDLGFIVIQNVVDQEKVNYLQEIYGEISSLRKEKNLNPYVSHLMPHTWDPRILEVAKTDAIVRCAELLLEGRIDLIHTQITFKPPQDHGFSIHQDNYYNGAEPAGNILAVWLALDDANAANGTLSVYPYSHREGVQPVTKHWSYFMKRAPGLALQSFRRGLGADIGGYEKRYSETVEGFADAVVPPNYQPQTVNMKAGSIGFMHGNLFHGSGHNKTIEEFRRNLLMNFVKQGTKFKAGMLSRRKAVNIYN